MNISIFKIDNRSEFYVVLGKIYLMKIVIVIDSWNNGNGCIVTTHRLVEELQSRGHEISLVSTKVLEKHKMCIRVCFSQKG